MLTTTRFRLSSSSTTTISQSDQQRLNQRLSLCNTISTKNSCAPMQVKAWEIAWVLSAWAVQLQSQNQLRYSIQQLYSVKPVCLAQPLPCSPLLECLPQCQLMGAFSKQRKISQRLSWRITLHRLRLRNSSSNRRITHHQLESSHRRTWTRTFSTYPRRTHSFAQRKSSGSLL